MTDTVQKKRDAETAKKAHGSQRTVSIIVPLYKSEMFLSKLLDSLGAQTYPNLEIILVDDGSPDRSGIIADDYARQDSRFRVIHQMNGGTCAARNAGLAVATGTYLMFADGDDWLEEDCVEYLVRLLEDNGCQMSMTDSVFTTRDRIQNERDYVRVWTSEEAVAGIIDTFRIPVGPWNKLYSADIIREHGLSFSVSWFGEGLYFSTMAAQWSDRVAVGHRKVYSYRLNNPNSGTTVKRVENGLSALENIYYIRDQLEIDSPDIQDALNWHIFTNSFNLLAYVVASGDKRSYIEEYKRAKLGIRSYLRPALRNRYLTFGMRLRMVAMTLLPDAVAKWNLKRSKKAFQQDRMD